MPETAAAVAAPERGPVRRPAQVYAVAAVSALGGLPFGCGTGRISGALPYPREDLHLPSRRPANGRWRTSSARCAHPGHCAATSP